MPSGVKLTARMATTPKPHNLGNHVAENPYESTQRNRGRLSQGRSPATNILRSMLFGASTISLMFALLMLGMIRLGDRGPLERYSPASLLGGAAAFGATVGVVVGAIAGVSRWWVSRVFFDKYLDE